MIQQILNKIGLVLNLQSTFSNDRAIIIGILKSIKKDIDILVKEIEEGN